MNTKTVPFTAEQLENIIAQYPTPFHIYDEEGIIEKVITTNLTYQTPELLSRDWYASSDVSKYVALLIDTLNHDASISDLLNPTERIKEYLEKKNL